MASYAAIAATSNAIRILVSNALATSEFASTATVEPYQAYQLQKLIDEGSPSKISIFLYRIALSSVRRHIGPRVTADGLVYRPSIPLDLHYLVTAWAPHAETQHQLLGWCVRVLEDTPVIPTALLNAHQPGVEIFAPGETVELIWQTLSVQDLSEIWQVASTNMQPSAVYAARMVQLDSTVPIDEGLLVQTREFDYATGPA